MTNAYSDRKLIFSDENNDKESISVTILETFDTSQSYGLYLWPCSPILAQYIWYNRNEFIGKYILEIGAGTSLPGLVAAKIGAQKVILCDSAKFNKWPSMISEIIKLNHMIADRVSIAYLDWYDETCINEFIKNNSLVNVNIILGSDIFFNKKDFEIIIALLDKLFLYGHQNLKFVGTIERRSRSTMLKLHHLINMWDMNIEIVPLPHFSAETIYPNIVAGHDILLFVITKLRKE